MGMGCTVDDDDSLPGVATSTLGNKVLKQWIEFNKTLTGHFEIL